MKLSFQNRIAFHYMIATALIMALVFGTVYWVVNETVYQNLEADILFEARKHSKAIEVAGDSIWFRNKAELEEREHQQIQFNPVFVQLVNRQGFPMDKSPNLKSDYLLYRDKDYGDFFDTKLGGRSIRQIQLPITDQGRIEGHILTAMSSESAQSILRDLRNTLIGCYLFVLAGLYFASRFLAGRSILPIKEMTHTINRITQNNLQERVELPANRDELYDLATGFNKLLGRIASTLERERQFTSDASHQLRTPLASLRGTLEVLIRKQREAQEYEKKIRYSLSEIDRMSNTVEQLLLLARLEADHLPAHHRTIELVSLIEDCLGRYKKQIQGKDLKVRLDIQSTEGQVPQYYAELVIDNILHNAIKYSPEGGILSVAIDTQNDRPRCTIQDNGMGMKEEDIERAFRNFFRADAVQERKIPGTGLGLSIARKAARAAGAEIEVDSEVGQGTCFTILF
ncbi:MAG TPA: ATP-binding protein [Saprospiraceae bacterium]|nr:ATP-binding protein [Saprospiraceae bacterium]